MTKYTRFEAIFRNETLVDVRKKAFDRVCRLRDALDDFNSQEW